MLEFIFGFNHKFCLTPCHFFWCYLNTQSELIINWKLQFKRSFFNNTSSLKLDCNFNFNFFQTFATLKLFHFFVRKMNEDTKPDYYFRKLYLPSPKIVLICRKKIIGNNFFSFFSVRRENFINYFIFFDSCLISLFLRINGLEFKAFFLSSFSNLFSIFLVVRKDL